ncbi:MAG: hypothetical protein PHE77_02965 [Candidatus Pacebacteria bacterium]|nr:hypothetical protein [Candidatus Paceibacterota bacterium]
MSISSAKKTPTTLTASVQQPETVLSLVYQTVPKKITLQPDDLKIGQAINCQTWSVTAGGFRTKNLWIQIKFSEIPRLNISRGRDCPEQAMVRGYLDGRIEFKSESSENFKGEILIVSSIKAIAVEVIEPQNVDVKAEFTSYGKIIPLIVNRTLRSFVVEVNTIPVVPLVSLFAEENWSLDSWEIPEMGWARIKTAYIENPFLAPPLIIVKEIGKRNILPMTKQKTVWGAWKSCKE